jgi:hypothetical protein
MPGSDEISQLAAPARDAKNPSVREAARAQVEEIIRQERALILEANPRHNADMAERWLGLALSGGGIRSASFALGVLQALHNWGLFRRIDYLSTVSGGGYIGSSLTYFLQAKEMGARNEFPFGERNKTGARSVRVAEAPEAAQAGDAPPKAPPPNPKAIVGFLRLHAHYLTPSSELGWPEFIGSAIRAAFTALAVYFPLLLAAATTLVLSEFVLAHWLTPELLQEHLKCWGNVLLTIEKGRSVCGPPATETNGEEYFNWPLVGLLLIILFSVLNALSFVLRTHSVIGDPKRRGEVYPGVTIDNAKRNGRLFVAFVVFVVLSALPWLVHFLNMGLATVAGASISTLAGYLGTLWDFRSRLKGATAKGSMLAQIRPIVFAVLTTVGLLVLAMAIAQRVVAWDGRDTSYWYGAGFVGVLILLSLVLNYFSNLNLISQHRMYRDRLMEAFCPSDRALQRMKWRPSTGADTLRLSECAPKANGGDDRLAGPYHIINTALVVPRAKSTLYRSRSGDNFVLSPLACGSDATGWAGTRHFMADSMTLPTAMAISGAALNAHSGAGETAPTRNAVLGFLLTLFGAQLGFWASHPLAETEQDQKRQPRFLNPGVYGLTGYGLDGSKSRKFVQLADGGHFENLALYELIRRRTDVIICSDAAQDQDYGFEDLGIAVERIRVDFGTSIEFQFPSHGPAHLIPGSRSPNDKWAERYALATRGFAIAEIRYPEGDNLPKKSGYLLYFKSTLIEGLPSDLYAYKKLNPDFPNQTTVDQDFDEYQFEAYRELGYRLATQCFVELFGTDKDQEITLERLWDRLVRVDRIANRPA